ncbi:MAG: molybdopterin-synthase adenylyltransferase MoeB [Candidatus Schmidhempelia sp.]|nr:molybdopterin-synthase adenylyltransferase MoeB [Candidatus Schmidhempelia sp.]
MTLLNNYEYLRYDRQISIKAFDIDGQQQLKKSKALIIGMGGLGCSVAQYLTASGIGKLTLVDFDIVSESNLSRQILYSDQHIGKLKVKIAAEELKKHNGSVDITAITSKLDDQALIKQVKLHDILIDCSDNLDCRQQINRIAYQYKVPLISGAAIRMEGMLTTFTYQEPQQPCYHCLSQFFGHEPLTCVETGVMSPLVGIIGSMQAMEAIKVLTHFGQPLVGRLLTIDAMTMEFQHIQFYKNINCPICTHES